MSHVYSLEPATQGKVILVTTVGDIEIELWPKETPKACRNFVQLCLEKYYDDTIFHRVIKDFIIQAGDPTGTGEGGESIYGESFPIEIHSRIRFNHRGLIAMANSGTKLNGSQFFITVAPNAEHLTGKNTIFGKIVGDTIFNVLKINEYQLDEDGRPLIPPKILRTEVVWNPFDDITPRPTVGKKRNKEENFAEIKKAKIAKIAKKDLNVLSFGDEGDGEDEVFIPTKKMLAPPQPKNSSAGVPLFKKKSSEEKPPVLSGNEEEKSTAAEKLLKQNLDAKDFQKKMIEKIQSAKNQFEKPAAEPTLAEKKAAAVAEQEKSKTDEKKKAKREAILLLEQDRLKYQRKRSNKDERQKKALEKLELFKQKLKQQTDSSAITKGDDSKKELMYDKEYNDDNEPGTVDPNWMTNKLKFTTPIKDPQLDDYVVIDPLKGKAETKHQKHVKSLTKEKKIDKW